MRPAEAAARRLTIATARGLVVTLLPPRKRKPKPATAEPLLRRFGIAVVVSPADIARSDAIRRTAALRAARPRSLTLPLFDPPRRILSRGNHRTVPAHAAPRILFPGVAQSYPLPSPPSPDDPIDAKRLGLRLAALAAALDDLPGQAKRFARWKARNNARESAPPPAGASRRSGADVRRAAVSRASIRPPTATPQARKEEEFPATSGTSTRSWPTPMRWRSTRWSAPTRHDPTGHVRRMR